jgi:hypothetical protein
MKMLRMENLNYKMLPECRNMCKIKHAGKYKEFNLSIDQPATNLLAHACPLLAA